MGITGSPHVFFQRHCLAFPAVSVSYLKTHFSYLLVLIYGFLLQVVGVSAVLGTGLDDFFVQLSKAVEEYER